MLVFVAGLLVNTRADGAFTIGAGQVEPRTGRETEYFDPHGRDTPQEHQTQAWDQLDSRVNAIRNGARSSAGDRTALGECFRFRHLELRIHFSIKKRAQKHDEGLQPKPCQQNDDATKTAEGLVVVAEIRHINGEPDGPKEPKEA